MSIILTEMRRQEAQKMYPPLVLAMGPTPTIVWQTLHLREPVDTIRAMPTCIRRIIYACNNEKTPNRIPPPKSNRLLRIHDYC